MSELYSKLFVQTPRSHPDLLTFVASASKGTVDDGWTVVSGLYEMDVRPNDESTEEAHRAHPGDFLYFPYTVEVVTESIAGETSDYVQFVASLMKQLYADGMQVVAACDWEDELPGGGRLGI